MPETEIRPARPEDREAVLAFCEQTWEWGDYIEYVWDEWLHDSKGILFVATIDGKSVAVSHLQMLNETDAWLEGMRVRSEEHTSELHSHSDLVCRLLLEKKK